MWHADGNMYAFEGKQNKKMKCHTPALSRILFLAYNYNRRKKSRFLTFKTIKNRKSKLRGTFFPYIVDENLSLYRSLYSLPAN